MALEESDLRQRWQRRPLIVAGLLILCIVVETGLGWTTLMPTEQAALDWGGQDNGLLLHQHEYWRLLAATFVHFGPVHLLFNGYALWVLGSFQERFFGAGRFLLIYCSAALAGNLATLWLLPAGEVSVGASGAVFGLLGAQFVVERLQTLPPAWRRHWMQGVAPWILLNLGLGLGVNLFSTGIELNNYAHVGGLLGGTAVTWLLGARPSAQRWDLAAAGGWLLGLVAVGCCLFGVYHGLTNDPRYILYGWPL